MFTFLIDKMKKCFMKFNKTICYKDFRLLIVELLFKLI